MDILSILIPTYDRVCVKLAGDLQRQAEKLGCPYEILVADDASGEGIRRENRKINGIPGCKYIELCENVGRSRIRNILGRQARGDYLIFVDSDAAVASDDFLSRYMAVREEAQVVYGGLMHPERLPSPEVSLAYSYEKRAESRFTVEKRARHPYEVFRTFNFMIARDTFLRHPFDETVLHYGHEDTLFGKALKECGIGILHIDNPLMNCGLDTNRDMLRKTEESLRTLYAFRGKLEGCSGVLHMCAVLRRLRLVPLVSTSFRLLGPAIRRNLSGKHPSLALYTFYKVGYYCTLSGSTGGCVFSFGDPPREEDG